MIRFKYKILAWSLSMLLIALPINTLLVQLFVVKLGLPIWLALWKEMLAGVAMLICGWDIIIRAKSKDQSAKINASTYDTKSKLKTFTPLILVGLMTVIGVLSSIGKVNFSYFVYGLRFELFWVWFWVILAVWGKGEIQSSEFKVQSSKVMAFGHSVLALGSKTALLIGFLLSSLFSLVTIVFGAQNILTWLGYGQKSLQSGSELLFTQPTGHLIDAGGWNSDFRLSSGFSSPNHYATYLILLLPLFLFKVFYTEKETRLSRWFWIVCLVLDLVFLILTYARFSYLALFVIFGVLIVFKVQSSRFKVQNWVKNGILSLIFAIPILISVIILNLPISILQTHFPSYLSKPSSTEWHQQHTSAAWRVLTLQTHPEILNQNKLTQDEILKLETLIQKSNDPAAISYRLLTGYGMGTTDPASKYLPLNTNPIASLGFGLDDELYFPRAIERPLALTPENWFLGLWVKGGVFYMIMFLAVMSYFMRDIRLLLVRNITTLHNPKNMLKLIVSLSIFGLTIGAFLLDIFDSQSLALLIGPIYLVYIKLILSYD